MVRFRADKMHFRILAFQLCQLRSSAHHPLFTRQIKVEKRLEIFSTATRPTFMNTGLRRVNARAPSGSKRAVSTPRGQITVL